MGHLSKLGLGVPAQRASKKLPRAGGNQSKGQECSQGFWASSLYCAKGIGLPREGERGQREQRLLEPDLGRSEEKVPGQEGWTALFPVPGARGGKSQSVPGRLDQHQHAQDPSLWILWSSSEGMQGVNFISSCFSTSDLLTFGID